jgi:hypothetical protein
MADDDKIKGAVAAVEKAVANRWQREVALTKLALFSTLPQPAPLPPRDPIKDEADERQVGGEALVKRMKAADKADAEGRYGYEALQILKGVFVDVPRHQFSAGDEAPKPLETPTVETASAKTPEVKTR